MLRRFITFLLLISLFNTFLTSSTFANFKSNSSCYKLGKKLLVDNKRYICVEVKNNKKWKIDKSQKIDTNSFVNDVIRDGMQNLVNEIHLPEENLNVEIKYYVEPGNNGQYQSMIESLFEPSFSLMKTLSGENPFPTIFVLFGRSQSWLRKMRESLCTTSNLEVVAADSISPCNDQKNTGLIEINLPGVVTEKFLDADPLIDLSQIYVNEATVERIRNLAPHEYFHFWQGSLNLKSPPSWFSEGMAQVFSMLVRTKVDTKKRSYSEIFDSWFTKSEVSWSQQRCISSIADVTYSMEFQCQYLQGIIPAEILLVEYGGFPTLRRLMNNNSRLDFSDAFLETTGQSLTSFYKRVDEYANTKGWKSGK